MLGMCLYIDNYQAFELFQYLRTLYLSLYLSFIDIEFFGTCSDARTSEPMVVAQCGNC